MVRCRAWLLRMNGAEPGQQDQDSDTKMLRLHIVYQEYIRISSSAFTLPQVWWVLVWFDLNGLNAEAHWPQTRVPSPKFPRNFHHVNPTPIDLFFFSPPIWLSRLLAHPIPHYPMYTTGPVYPHWPLLAWSAGHSCSLVLLVPQPKGDYLLFIFPLQTHLNWCLIYLFHS